MIKTFFKKIGWIEEKKENTTHPAVAEFLRNEVERLATENENLKKQQEYFGDRERDKIPVAGFDNMDVEPSDEKERRDYINDVVSFFESKMNAKIRVTVADIRQNLSWVGRREVNETSLTDEQYDFFLRGMEAMAWKMDEWYKTLKSEQLSKEQELENTFYDENN